MIPGKAARFGVDYRSPMVSPPARKSSATDRSPGTARKAGPAAHDLYSSPEFLIRRAHQVASAAFAEACAELDLTPSQYAALYALREQGHVGQNELGRLVSLDRSTVSVVVRCMLKRGLITAQDDESDRRKSSLLLTDDGRALLEQAERCSAEVDRRLLSRLGAGEAERFVAALRKLSASDEPT